MKIGVISDTHGLVRPEVYKAFEGVDLILHAGDIGTMDVIIELEAIAPVKAVAGNVDVGLRDKFKEKIKFELNSRAFHLQHIFENIPEEANPNRESVLELIGQTPMMALRKVVEAGSAQVLAKLESFNPSGSIKDRIALAIVEDAEAQGLIVPGDTLVYATSGNSGAALAMVATAKGYRLTIFMPSNAPLNQRRL